MNIIEHGRDLRTYQRSGEISYKRIVEALELNRDFFHSSSSIPQTIHYGQSVGRAVLQAIPEALMVCGDGYPYYVARLDDPPIPVPEIGRFNNEIVLFYRQKLLLKDVYNKRQNDGISIEELREMGVRSAGSIDPYSAEKNGLDAALQEDVLHDIIPLYEHFDSHTVEVDTEVWPCLSCIETNDWPNLREPCNPCVLTSFKPRDIFRAFHDVDLQFIVDGEPNEIGSRIRETLHSIGVPCNDEYLDFVIEHAGRIFPVDVTVISQAEYYRGLERLSQSGDWLGIKIPAVKLWHRNEAVHWTIGRDFVFSMEPLIAKDLTCIDAFVEAKKAFMATHPIEKTIDQFAALPRAHGRLMQSPKVRAGMRTRLSIPSLPFLVEY